MALIGFDDVTAGLLRRTLDGDCTLPAHCAAGLTCDNTGDVPTNKCVAAVGHACTADTDCSTGSNLVCNLETGSGTNGACIVAPQAGAACQSDTDCCSTDGCTTLECELTSGSPTVNQCQPPAGVVTPEVGTACTSDTDCAGGSNLLCYNSLCNRTVDGACFNNADCTGGGILVCEGASPARRFRLATAGVCIPVAGQTCGSGGTCATNTICENTVCTSTVSGDPCPCSTAEGLLCYNDSECMAPVATGASFASTPCKTTDTCVATDSICRTRLARNADCSDATNTVCGDQLTYTDIPVDSGASKLCKGAAGADPCTDDTDCATGIVCDNTVCKSTTSPVGGGGDFSTTICAEGFQCGVDDLFVANPPPEETPTATPTEAPPATPTNTPNQRCTDLPVRQTRNALATHAPTSSVRTKVKSLSAKLAPPRQAVPVRNASARSVLLPV